MTGITDLPLHVVTDGSPDVERIEGLMRSIWSQVPTDDQVAMLTTLGEHFRGLLTIIIDCNWQRSYGDGTNAMIYLPRSTTMIIDGGYIHTADDRHISTTLAHELGHIRGFANGDLSEDTAHHFQQTVWGFSPGEVIFKCEVCRHMDHILFSEGRGGRYCGRSRIGERILSICLMANVLS